jgi:hypothetical protein
MQVAHGDGVRTNNVVGNLRWDTPLGNSADREKHGTVPKGDQLPQAKLNEYAVKAIREHVKAGGRYRAMMDKFGISAAQVSRVVSGKAWGHV